MFAMFLDESEQGRFLGIGGYMVKLAELGSIEQSWHQMKRNMGLEPDDEVKWNLPRNHPTRKKLESRGRKTKKLNENMIDCIAQLDISVCVVVMIEKRSSSWWRTLIGRKPNIRDFYCEGLRYLLQRLGETLIESKIVSLPSFCIVDKPEGIKQGQRPIPGKSLKWLQMGPKAPFELYRQVIRDGPGEGPKRLGNRPLRDLGCHSGLLVSHASHNDLLQIADCIVGCVTSWVRDIDKSEVNYWLIEQVKKLIPKFRGGSKEMFGDGLILWPKEEELWAKLQQTLDKN